MTRHLVLLVLCIPLGQLVACAAEGTRDGTRGDAGARPDAEVSDGGPASPFDGFVSATDASATDTMLPPAGLREDACFDFTDDDGDGASDCSDVGCRPAAICCAAGSDSPSCCRGGAAGGLDVGGCTTGDPAGCGDVRETFGAPSIAAGIVRDDACGTTAVTGLSPGGDERSDGGVLVGDALDPTVARVRISATLGARLGGSALDAIGVGVTAQDEIDGRVLPLVAVLLSASDAELRVIVGDAVVSTTSVSAVSDAFACGASELHVELEVSPSGTFDAALVHPSTGARLVLGSGVVPAARTARVVVFGRGEAPGVDGPAAWLGALSIHREVCSVMSPGRDEGSMLGTGWTVSPRSVGRLTVLPERGLAALLVDGRIYAGTIDTAGSVVIPDPGVANAMVRPIAPYAGGIDGPELVLDGSNAYLLFAGRAMPGGPSSIYSLALGASGEVLGTAQLLVDPSALNTNATAEFSEATPALSVDSPAFFVHGGRRVLLVRVETVDHTTELRFLERLGGLDASGGVADGAEAAGVTRRDEPDTTRWRLHANRAGDVNAFDRNEIGAAQVIDLGDGVVRVLYSGRNGTRWSIGMLLSEDLVHFDFGAAGEPILSGDGVGFDALSVSSPEPIAITAAPGVAELRMFYVGSDGLRTRVGLASQSIAVVAP